MLIFKTLYWTAVASITAALLLLLPAEHYELVLNELGIILYVIVVTGGYVLGLRLLSLATGGRNKEIERELEEQEGLTRLNLVHDDEAGGRRKR